MNTTNTAAKTTALARVAAGSTTALALALLLSAHGSVSAKTSPAGAGQVSQGKTLVSTYRCNGCHGANLAGRPGFSPSLHRSAVLKQYTSATFTRLLLTGITDDGGHVRPPMPVYGAGAKPMGPGMGHGGPPPGGMRPAGMEHPGMGHGGPPPGGMGHRPPPMSKGQAAALYAYLHTLS